MSIEVSEQKTLVEFMAGYVRLARKRNTVAAVKYIPHRISVFEIVCTLAPLVPSGMHSPTDIRDAVLCAFGVSLQDFISVRRATIIVRARHCFYWLCTQSTSLSYAKIGKLSGKDHSTVFHGANRFESMKNQYLRELSLITLRLGS